MTEKNITIEYFAILREERGQNSEAFRTSANTARELYEELRSKYTFSMSSSSLKVAINSEFKDWNDEIFSGDIIVFIPPVAGG